MKECWSEGELRAYIDRELPEEDIHRVAAHLEECSECGDLWAELAGRADRVSALMHELAAPEPVFAAPRKLRRASPTRRWAAAAALAAAVMLGIALLPKHAPPAAMAPPKPPAVVPSAPAPTQPHNAVTLAAARASKAGSPRRNRRPAAPDLQGNGPFLALDDDPIESGTVWRVELGPREVPAEVIVDSDGRPRAIRLVNFKPNH